MMPHLYSVMELATLRHQEDLARCERERLAASAETSNRLSPGAIARSRTWLGSLLIRLGTLMTPPDHPVGALMTPAAAGLRAPGG